MNIETTTGAIIQPTKVTVTEKSTQPTIQNNKNLISNNVKFKTLYVSNKSNNKLHKSDHRHVKKYYLENIV